MCFPLLVKYYDKKTKIIFIQCNRDPHRNLMHAATLVKSIDSRPFSLQTLYIAGNIKNIMFSLCNMKIGRVLQFARLDYFTRAMACDLDRFLSIVSLSCCQEL